MSYSWPTVSSGTSMTSAQLTALQNNTNAERTRRGLGTYSWMWAAGPSYSQMNQIREAILTIKSGYSLDSATQGGKAYASLYNQYAALLDTLNNIPHYTWYNSSSFYYGISGTLNSFNITDTGAITVYWANSPKTFSSWVYLGGTGTTVPYGSVLVDSVGTNYMVGTYRQSTRNGKTYIYSYEIATAAATNNW
jgi:hypothetical protein